MWHYLWWDSPTRHGQLSDRVDYPNVIRAWKMQADFDLLIDLPELVVFAAINGDETRLCIFWRD